MKLQISLFLSFFFFIQNISAQSEKMLTGLVSSNEILTINHKWKINFDSFQPNENTKALFRINNNNLEFEVHFGSWCDDSENWIPKLMKIFEVSGVQNEKIRYIGFDRSKEIMIDNQIIKADFLPTILIKRNGTLIGTIIENPKTDLEKDLDTIISLP